jgi:hypothetical protein
MLALRDLVAAELNRPVDPQVAEMAEAIAAQHGQVSRAVLFYGSCLREKQLDGLMLDFYLVVSNYRGAYDRRRMAILNRLVPPNVFYFEHGGLRCKYSVLSEPDFHRLNGPETRSVSIWARFAQPTRIAWAADAAARDTAIDAIARAPVTLLAAALSELDGTVGPLDLWRGAFVLTYSAELRAERQGREKSIVDFDPERYRRFTGPVRKEVARLEDSTKASWRRRRLEGKALSVLRHAKGIATFVGGADYIVWKINRHAGTDIELKPWQRRWPLVAAITLVPRLLRSGAIR